jgi:hypothetical protein
MRWIDREVRRLRDRVRRATSGRRLGIAINDASKVCDCFQYKRYQIDGGRHPGNTEGTYNGEATLSSHLCTSK